MLATIRLFLGSLIFVICLVIIKKSTIVHKRRWHIISFVACAVLASLSALIPLENAFVTYNSPESSFKYVNSCEAQLVVEGKETAFVIGNKGDTDIYLIVPKSKSGWKLGMGLDTKRVMQRIYGEMSIDVYRYKDTNDYYITVFDKSGGILDITDGNNSKFYYLKKINTTLNTDFYTYYAYVQNFNNQCSLCVNGKTISLLKQ